MLNTRGASLLLDCKARRAEGAPGCGVTAHKGCAVTRNMPKSILPFGRRLLSRPPGAIGPRTPGPGGHSPPDPPRVAGGYSPSSSGVGWESASA